MTVLSLAKIEKKEDLRVWAPDPAIRYLILHRPSGVWYVRKRKKGKRRLFKSTGQTAKGAARTAADSIIARWLGNQTISFGSDEILFSEYATLALQDFEQSARLRVRTKENAKYYINALIPEIGYARLKDINEGFVESWIEEYRRKRSVEREVGAGKKQKARGTFRDYVLYIGKVLRHAARNGVIARMPEFSNPDPKRATGRLFSRQEMTRLFEEAEKAIQAAHERMNPQILLRALNTRAQLLGCFQAFLRKRELLCAPWSEIDLKTGRMIIPAERIKTGSQTGRGKDIFLPPELLPLLREIRSLQKPGCAWVFPNPVDLSRPVWDNKTAWKVLKTAAGITEKARWHDLRHTAMTWALLGDEETQAELERLPPEEQEKLRTTKLKNPVLVAAYSGTSIRTIEAVYLKVKAEHTREISTAIRI